MIQIRFYTQLSWSRIQRIPKMLGRGSRPQRAASNQRSRKDTQRLCPSAHKRRIAHTTGIEWSVMIRQSRISPA